MTTSVPGAASNAADAASHAASTAAAAVQDAPQRPDVGRGETRSRRV